MALFEGLAGRLQETLRKIRGAGRVTEKDIKEMMREIKLALLEADVNFKVVRDFINKVSERAVGQDVIESLTPGQQIIKIVNEELVELLGSTQSKLTYSSNPPTVYMMVGLQGAGKTTVSAKIAGFLKKQGKSPLLVACDIYRPAAIEQLKIVGSQVNVPVYFEMDSKEPVKIAANAVLHAKKNLNDVVIIDTAGRLHIDDELMRELERFKKNLKPEEILLVVDSMTGQDAVNVAESFNGKLGISGVILTKLDGDTRGGAALSVKAVTGKPIKFASTGEKMTDIEQFYPDRMASRILGMGDVLSLIEKAQESFDEKKAVELEHKMRTQQFTMDDYLDQLTQLKNMGPLEQILGMIPGMNSKAMKNAQFDEKKLTHIEAIIKAMTKKERVEPSIINFSRRRRISTGSGTSLQEVNSLLRSFDDMKKMFKEMMGPGKRRKFSGGFKMPV